MTGITKKRSNSSFRSTDRSGDRGCGSCRGRYGICLKKKGIYYVDYLFVNGNKGERKRQVAVSVSGGFKDEKGTTLISLQGADFSL